MTLVELLQDLRADLAHRYRSQLAVPMLLALLLWHWRLWVHVVLSKTLTPESLIELTYELVTVCTVGGALLSAVLYVVAIPWLEIGLHRVSSKGRLLRAELQAVEQEAILTKRKLIADANERLIDTEMRTQEKKAIATDRALASAYDSLLSGSQLRQGIEALRERVSDGQLPTPLRNYVSRANDVAGQFINKDVENLHKKAVEQFSLLAEALWGLQSNKIELERVLQLAGQAVAAQSEYRRAAREILNI